MLVLQIKLMTLSFVSISVELCCAYVVKGINILVFKSEIAYVCIYILPSIVYLYLKITLRLEKKLDNDHIRSCIVEGIK